MIGLTLKHINGIIWRANFDMDYLAYPYITWIMYCGTDKLDKPQHSRERIAVLHKKMKRRHRCRRFLLFLGWKSAQDVILTEKSERIDHFYALECVEG